MLYSVPGKEVQAVKFHHCKQSYISWKRALGARQEDVGIWCHKMSQTEQNREGRWLDPRMLRGGITKDEAFL